MRLSFQGERILAVVAHPDDAELLCAGTLGRARDDGADIGLCVLCRGDKGQSSNPPQNLSEIRQHEMGRAAELLKAAPFCGDFEDGTLRDTEEHRHKLLEIYRRFSPTLVLAHAMQDYHPDHRAAGVLAEAASWFAASQGQRSASVPLRHPPALWWMDTVNMHGFTPDFFVDITDYARLKESMLACHESQLDRAGDTDFAPLMELMRGQYRTRGTQCETTAAEAFQSYHAFKRARAW